MNQTPAHNECNQELLSIIPVDSRRIIEIGCSTGALAREFKKKSPDCNYFGVDIFSEYVEVARNHCDDTMCLDIELVDDAFWMQHRDRDCWIFGDTLEHLQNPWRILKKIRSVVPRAGAVVACIPNAQHWSMQVKLAIGDFRYQDKGLLDRTHLRWFTRQTIIELFADTGFKIEAASSRIFDEPQREVFVPMIESIAKLTGFDPKVAVHDSRALQYVVRAVPV